MTTTENPTSSAQTRQHWLWVLGMTLLLAIAAVAICERHFRRYGLTPTVLDDKDLWAQERARLNRYGDQAIALIGTSRMLFGIDPKRLKARLPGYQPIMLAINGAYPMASLRDLAVDASFKGIVVVDTDAMGFTPLVREMQAGHVQHFHTDFGPSRALHRRVLTQWQRRMVVADPNFGLVAMMQRRLFAQPPPQPRYASVAPNRAGALDFQRIDPAPLAKHFAQIQWDGIKKYPPPTPAVWLAGLKPVAKWVEMIQARGGQVLFFCTPTRGDHRLADEAGFPRKSYWDQATRALGAPAVYADDVPILLDIRTPDGSHVDQRDRDRLTDGLAIAMREHLRL